MMLLAPTGSRTKRVGPLGTVRDWQQGAHRPDKAAQVLLTVIARDPDAVARALES
jgi:putative transcriptional regulator